LLGEENPLDRTVRAGAFFWQNGWNRISSTSEWKRNFPGRTVRPGTFIIIFLFNWSRNSSGRRVGKITVVIVWLGQELYWLNVRSRKSPGIMVDAVTVLVKWLG
jgi:hypothetical protein